MSTCESLDINDKVETWIKTTQEASLDGQQDDGYPSNEEILNYVCGQGVKCYDPRQNDGSELLETEVDLCTLTNNDNREAADSMISHDDHNTESLSLLEERTLEGDNVQTFDKDGSHSIQRMINNTDHSFSAVESKANLNGTESNSCNNTNAINIDVVPSSGETSLNSIINSTEDISFSSISSCSINASVAEGEYIETKSSTYSAMEDIIHVPMQSYKSFHQNIVTHSHDEHHSSTSAIEGEYVDHNIAVRENEHISYCVNKSVTF